MAKTVCELPLTREQAESLNLGAQIPETGKIYMWFEFDQFSDERISCYLYSELAGPPAKKLARPIELFFNCLQMGFLEIVVKRPWWKDPEISPYDLVFQQLVLMLGYSENIFVKPTQPEQE